MLTPTLKNKGFTLVELIVVLAILAVLGVSAIIGFAGFGDNLIAQQISRSVEDVIRELEAEILTGEYERSVLYFQSDYLIATSYPEGANETLLQWIEIKDVNCPEGENNVFNTDPGTLTLKNGEGTLLQIQELGESGTCLNFKEG